MEIKSCLYCGGVARLRYEHATENTWRRCACVQCDICGARSCLFEDDGSGDYESKAIDNWNRRASPWVSVKERLPEAERRVLIRIKSKRFPSYLVTTVGAHVGYHEKTTEDWNDYEGDTEYDEKNDCFWISPCWYETNEVEDNTNWEFGAEEYEVTHWMPLPQAPED